MEIELTTALFGEILRMIEETNRLNDLDAILDRFLTEARRLTRAEAGTIFLVEDGKLHFSYVHNDALYGEGTSNVQLYQNFSIDINASSIVGYAALTGETVVIDDAYAIPADRPYRFNTSFDAKTGFRTVSIVSLPLKNTRDELLGVMQLINAKDDQGRSAPFSETGLRCAQIFASSAATAIERGRMTRELILRMLAMAELHDPKETGAHVQRVGAYSAEIFHRYAIKAGMSKAEIKSGKDLIRLAAMLHDVGKVGVSDLILKKPGKLDDDEFSTMRGHTLLGAKLFDRCSSELDHMCRDIALSHHERWDGRGYPAGGPSMREEAIPLPARIASLADVYDALTSQRSYKDAWPEEKVLSVIREESGKQFDPKVVESFLEVYDVILAIKAKYKGPHPQA